MLYLLYDSDLITPQSLKSYALLIRQKFGKVPIKKEFRKNFTDFEDEAIIFIYAKESDIKRWIEAARQKKFTIFFIPNDKSKNLQKIFKIPSSFEKYLNEHTFVSHLTFFNDTLILNRAVIAKESWIESQNLLKSFMKNIFNIKLFKLNISVNDKQIKSAALMIEASNEYVFKVMGYPFFQDTGSCDRSAVIVYAPTSIIEAFKLKFHLMKKPVLPKGVGVIKSKTVTLQSEDELSVVLDGEKFPFEKRAVIKTQNTNLHIASGWEGCQPSQKDSIRIDTLPKDEELIEFYTKKSLPLLPIASEEQFAALFKKIRENAKINPVYMTLLIISVLMATIGLFQNSAPTIIGAMILAPLMAPIISFSMGVVRFEKSLMARSLKTISVSVFTGLSLSTMFAFLLPYRHVTEQMALRMNPTLLDLAVAILAGIAGGYGYANSKVGESLAGVAIAVALVPPLCVAGIGLGWMDMDMFWQAFLLFFANIVGIAFAAGTVFYLLGFASSRYVAAAFILKISMILVIIFPLYISTQNFFLYERIYDEISRVKYHQVELKIDSVYTKEGKIYVEIELAAKDEAAARKAAQTLKKRFPDLNFVVIYKKIV